MKIGFGLSAGAHVAALGFAMVSLAAPKPLDVPDVEALPIDIVPIESITKTLQGAKKADIAKVPAPKPTKKPPTPKPAENAGETEVDKKVEAPKVEKKPPVETTEAPTPKLRPDPPKKPTPVPTPELAPKPKPKTDIALLAKENAEVTEEKPVEETFQKLPEQVVKPKQRPQAKKPEQAETNERKNVKEVAKEKAKKGEKKKETKVTKKAVVNKEKSSAGGAKASKKKAALGAKKSNNSSKLAQSEIDALRGRLEGCWNVGDLTGHPDAGKMSARVNFKLTRGGDIDGRVKVRVSGTDRATKTTLTLRVRAAVEECAPYTLPAEKYETWADVVVNFSLADML